MADWTHTHRGREIWITRGHLIALGVATFFIALLAFFVGIQVGRGQINTPNTTISSTLLPDSEKEDALEALLREVEAAQAEEIELAFPNTLSEGKSPPSPVEEVAVDTSVTLVIPTAEPPPTPPLAPPKSAPLPTKGWSVQIASYDTVADADRRVSELREKDLEAYRVAALIKGQTWYRVRIGGYSTKEAAMSGREDLMEILGSSDLLLAEAP